MANGGGGIICVYLNFSGAVSFKNFITSLRGLLSVINIMVRQLINQPLCNSVSKQPQDSKGDVHLTSCMAKS